MTISLVVQVPLLLAKSVKPLQRLSIVTNKSHHIPRERTSRTSTGRSLENQFNKIPCHWPRYIKRPHHRVLFSFFKLSHFQLHYPPRSISITLHLIHIPLPFRHNQLYTAIRRIPVGQHRGSREISQLRRPKISFPGLENVVSSSLNATTDRLVQSPDAEHYSWLRTESSLKRPSSLSRVLAACKPEEHAQLATVLQRVLRLLLLLFRRQDGTTSMRFKNTRVLASGIQSVTKGSVTLATYGRYSSSETRNA